jgi:molybdopterin synthase sulfurtransferase
VPNTLLMGWPRVAIYYGGWFEWSQDPVANPIEVAEDEDEAGRSGSTRG